MNAAPRIDYFNACYLSAQLSGRSAKDNIARHRRLGAVLASENIPHLAVVGRYAGKCEDSYIITTPFANAVLLGLEFGQESILQTVDGNAILYYIDGRPVISPSLGKLEHTTSLPTGDYTKLPNGGGFLVCIA